MVPDPMAEMYANASPYNYVNNSPINNYDPNGMWWSDDLSKEEMMGDPDSDFIIWVHEDGSYETKGGGYSHMANFSGGIKEVGYSYEELAAKRYIESKQGEFMDILIGARDFLFGWYSDMVSSYIKYKSKLAPVNLDASLAGKTFPFGRIGESKLFKLDPRITNPEVLTPWMAIAKIDAEFGVQEIPGDQHNPKVVGYFKATTHSASTDDSPNEWCSAYINHIHKNLNMPRTNSALAKSWLKHGARLSSFSYGAIVVTQNKKKPVQWHVAYGAGATDDYVLLLGGNQGSPGRVKYSIYNYSDYNIWFIDPTKR